MSGAWDVNSPVSVPSVGSPTRRQQAIVLFIRRKQRGPRAILISHRNLLPDPPDTGHTRPGGRGPTQERWDKNCSEEKLSVSLSFLSIGIAVAFGRVVKSGF